MLCISLTRNVETFVLLVFYLMKKTTTTKDAGSRSEFEIPDPLSVNTT